MWSIKIRLDNLKFFVLILGCEKIKMRGYKCSYRVKFIMRLGYVNYWFVEVFGDYD